MTFHKQIKSQFTSLNAMLIYRYFQVKFPPMLFLPGWSLTRSQRQLRLRHGRSLQAGTSWLRWWTGLLSSSSSSLFSSLWPLTLGNLQPTSLKDIQHYNIHIIMKCLKILRHNPPSLYTSLCLCN